MFSLVTILAIVVPTSASLASHGGEFSIDYKTARPANYSTTFPFNQSCPSGGRASEPLPGAQHATGQESLTPAELILGQIVAFEFEITVGGSAPADSSIEFQAGWETVTTSAGDFGYDEAFLVYCAFVDTGDPSTADPEGDATATVSSALVGTEIQGTFQVSGLDAGDVVVVEAWLVLDRRVPQDTSGNVQSRLIGANTLTPDEDTINTGAQNIPLLRVQEFRGAILVQKVIASGSDDSATFDFTGAITATLGHGEISDPVVVDDGTYEVTETVPSGWSDPSIVCDDDDSAGSGPTANFIIDTETVVCTFTNAEAPVETTATTSTTAPISPVTTQGLTTLPFTGANEAALVGFGLLLLAVGALMVVAARQH